MTARPVPAAVRPVAVDWARLHHDHEPGAVFDEAMLDALPKVGRAYLRHTLTPGVRLAPSVELTMHGHVRLGAWRPFNARQILAPGEGFVWAATARVAGLPITGFDRYSNTEGQMLWRLLGLVPVVSASGPDVSRSAAGRLAGEAILCPTAFQRCRWDDAGRGHVTATWRTGDRDEVVELRVDDDGRLREVRMQRWGNPGGAPFGDYPFGVEVLEERTFHGIRIPSSFRAGWWWGTDREAHGEFFRATVTAARFPEPLRAPP